ncbi:MAG: hypothetical protein WCG78_03205 [Candidatus Omnitrophota bacterium]
MLSVVEKFEIKSYAMSFLLAQEDICALDIDREAGSGACDSNKRFTICADCVYA